MNARIKQLWDLSRNPSGRGHDEEKFAQLIVRECANLVDDHDDSYPYSSFGIMIKKHFGVEE